MAFSLSRRWGPPGLLAVLLIGIVLLQVVGQPPAAKKPAETFECRWTDVPITIDGKMDEKAWSHAQLIDRFSLPWLKAPRAARTTTKARLLWDREYLYFFADMEDADLYADIKEHDGPVWNNDALAIFLKPAENRPGYYEFQVNAAGTILDMFLPSRGAGGYRRFKSDGEFHVESKTRLRGTLNKRQDRDEGWSVEGRIPWKDLLRTGGRPEPAERWKFALCRHDYSADFDGPELSSCAPFQAPPSPDSHAYEDYATLQFVGPAKETTAPHGVAQRVALTNCTVVGAPDPPPPYRIRRAYPNLAPNHPIAVTHQPGSDRLLFLVQGTSSTKTDLCRMKDAPETRDFETLLKLDGTAYDVTFHPRFAENGFMYVGWNGPSSGKDKQTKVTRYVMDRQPPYTLDPRSEKLIIVWDSNGHNGGAIAFGHDGMLYVTSGDGTSDSDTNVVGQDMTTLLAKVLRIDVDHPDEGRGYSIPKDNPFHGQKGIRWETWAYGLRNPWRITVDAKTGHVWVGQNGQDLWEQAFLVQKGDNYGWSVMEGSHPFYPTRKPGPTPFVKPTVEHPHSEARSLTGGIVYYGEKHPDLRGAYLYGDYSTGKIWGIRHDGKKALWHKEVADTRLQITGFGVDSHGEVLICDHRGGGQGGFYTLEPTPKDRPASTFPRTLSASGLFRSVKGHVMQPALIPYSVNSPLWSDGAYKERWLGLPGADSTIEFTRSRTWGLPDQTVLVKSFALEMEEGNPQSRRWIETRFLTRQQGEWFGYSYAWNDEQTEGTLVGAAGTDREFTRRVPKSKEHPDGLHKQKWHYPSRSECMVCHSRAANYVLGLNEVQMNREHDYGGVRDNQLRVLEHLGVLRVKAFEEMKNSLREEAEKKGLSDKEIKAYVEKQTTTRGQRGPVVSSLLAFAPANYRALADPYDPKQVVMARARSYLHANCAQCHVEAGGGNAQMELGFQTKLEKMRLLDVKPVHHTFGLTDARLVAPGHPERSVLLHRLSHRDAGYMPPLATSEVDREAVKMLHDWIKQLPLREEKPPDERK